MAATTMPPTTITPALVFVIGATRKKHPPSAVNTFATNTIQGMGHYMSNGLLILVTDPVLVTGNSTSRAFGLITSCHVADHCLLDGYQFVIFATMVR